MNRLFDDIHLGLGRPGGGSCGSGITFRPSHRDHQSQRNKNPEQTNPSNHKTPHTNPAIGYQKPPSSFDQPHPDANINKAVQHSSVAQWQSTRLLTGGCRFESYLRSHFFLHNSFLANQGLDPLRMNELHHSVWRGWTLRFRNLLWAALALVFIAAPVAVTQTNPLRLPNPPVI